MFAQDLTIRPKLTDATRRLIGDVPRTFCSPPLLATLTRPPCRLTSQSPALLRPATQVSSVISWIHKSPSPWIAAALLAVSSGCAHWYCGNCTPHGPHAHSGSPPPECCVAQTLLGVLSDGPAGTGALDDCSRRNLHRPCQPTKTLLCDSAPCVTTDCCPDETAPLECDAVDCGSLESGSPPLSGPRCAVASCPPPGTPPQRYRPAMPPKFLPVPTRPIYGTAPADAPHTEIGDVEVDFGPRLTFPGRR
jgi:hypothetical protein